MSDQPALFDLPAAAADDAGERIEQEFLLLTQTRLALGISRDGTTSKARRNIVWIPISEITFDLRGARVHIKMPRWLALDKGLIE